MQPHSLHPVAQVIMTIGLIKTLYDWLKKPKGVSPPPNPHQKKKKSEKQLETLRKTREAKAAKARGVKATPQRTEDVSATEEVSPPTVRQEIPKRVKKPTPKAKAKPTLIEVPAYHEEVEPTSKNEMLNVF